MAGYRLGALAPTVLVLICTVATEERAIGHEVYHFQPLGRDDQFEMVFNDEFDEPLLSLDRWTTCFWWDDNGCTISSNSELQWYTPENVTVKDGMLVLTAHPESVVGHGGDVFPYTSGVVTTGRYDWEEPSETRFEATYGFFEVRARVPSGQGLLPAFWMLPSSLESTPEIDIMEVLGHDPTRLEMHIHYRDGGDREGSAGRDVVSGDLSADWHVYGLDWSRDRLVWYLDGEEVWRYRDKANIPNEPMYLIINLAVGGNWPGDPDSTTRFPARLEIDYVRAWRRP